MFFELAPFLGISAGGIIRCPRSPNTPVNFDFFAFVVFTKMYNLQFVLFSTHTHTHTIQLYFSQQCYCFCCKIFPISTYSETTNIAK